MKTNEKMAPVSKALSEVGLNVSEAQHQPFMAFKNPLGFVYQSGRLMRTPGKYVDKTIWIHER